MDDNREFKIDLHSTDPDDNSDIIDPVAKPPGQSRKASILFVVCALILFGGIFGFLYYNLNSKIQTINTQGSAGIANLSKELNDKLSDFSQQFFTQQEATRVLVSDLDTKLKDLSSSVSAVAAGKVDKKELAEKIKQLQDKIPPLQESVEQFNEQLTEITEETEKITVHLNKIQTGVLNNKKEINTLSATSIDRDSFEKQLKKEREFNQENMAHASETLFSEIATLHQLIDDMEKKIEQVSTAAPNAQKPAGNIPEKTKLPSEDLYIPKPGEIIEQELN